MKPSKKFQRRLYPILCSLKAQRLHAGIEQDVLAEIIGYHWVTLSRWERGCTMPSFQALHDWCDALGVEIKLTPKGSPQ